MCKWNYKTNTKKKNGTSSKSVTQISHFLYQGLRFHGNILQVRTSLDEYLDLSSLSRSLALRNGSVFHFRYAIQFSFLQANQSEKNT